MKTLYTYILIGFLGLIYTQNINAQQIGDLNGINFQAVAIDEDGKEIVGMDEEGKPLYEANLEVRFTITTGQDGDVLYQETQETITDAYGHFSLVIGQGNLTGSGQYDVLLDIPWIEANQWLKVELKYNGNDFRLVSNQKFQSVPYSFYTDDIADDAITTSKILNEEILSEDISNGTILNEDLADDAISTEKILDGEIINEDVADGTLDLTAKVTNILPVENGGTGTDSVPSGHILIGNGLDSLQSIAVDDSAMLLTNSGGATELYKLRPGPRTSIDVDDVNKTITITALQQSGPGTGAGSVSVPNVASGSQVERNFPAAGVQPGDIILATIDQDLQGLTMTAYVRQAGQVIVLFFNGSGQPVNLGPVTVNFANFGQP